MGTTISSSDLFAEPPRCPPGADSLTGIAYPSITFVELLILVTTLMYFIFCVSKYHSIRVFDKVISTPITSNFWWIVYFASISTWSLFASLKFGLHGDAENRISTPFVIVDLVLYGLIPFSLALALEHQRAYRSKLASSGNPSPEDRFRLPNNHGSDTSNYNNHSYGSGGGGSKFSSGDGRFPEAYRGPEHLQSSSRHISISPQFIEDDPFGHSFQRQGEAEGHSDPVHKQCDNCMQKYFAQTLIVLFLVLYYVFMSLATSGGGSGDETIFYYVFVGTFCMQRLPVLLLGLLILIDERLPWYGFRLDSTPNDDGPSRSSKIYLLLGIICCIPDLLPLSLWDSVVGHGCALYIGSIVDLLQLIYGLSPLFFFLFTRSEYFRGLEHELWFGDQTARYATTFAYT